jgi:hypothetical protein
MDVAASKTSKTLKSETLSKISWGACTFSRPAKFSQALDFGLSKILLPASRESLRELTLNEASFQITTLREVLKSFA